MNRLSAQALRTMYQQGNGIVKIINYTEMTYTEVMERLVEAGTDLITGGPHDTACCRHDHSLAALHVSGACQHPAGKPHTKKSRLKAEDMAAAWVEIRDAKARELVSDG